jgi:hypothetical protein
MTDAKRSLAAVWADIVEAIESEPIVYVDLLDPDYGVSTNTRKNQAGQPLTAGSVAAKFRPLVKALIEERPTLKGRVKLLSGDVTAPPNFTRTDAGEVCFLHYS